MSEHPQPTSFSTSNTLSSLDLSLIKTIFGWEALSSAERFTYLSNRNRNRIIMDTFLRKLSGAIRLELNLNMLCLLYFLRLSSKC